MTNSDALTRFWSRVDREAPLGCWDWVAGKLSSGYGSFRTGNRAHVAHRYAYEALIGPIPDGLQLDHLCRNRSCVNPDHLEVVTQRVNLARGVSPPAINARKTHCSRGHEFTDENTYRSPDGYRGCRTCRYETKLRWDRERGHLRDPHKTHCKQGHEFTPENTVLVKNGTGRRCRQCRDDYMKSWREKNTVGYCVRCGRPHKEGECRR
jgi:hypothetical protein